MYTISHLPALNNFLFPIVGFVSNGEYNVFRLKGYTRPVSVLKVKSNARNKFSSVAASTMEKMLTPKGSVWHQPFLCKACYVCTFHSLSKLYITLLQLTSMALW